MNEQAASILDAERRLTESAVAQATTLGHAVVRHTLTYVGAGEEWQHLASFKARGVLPLPVVGEQVQVHGVKMAVKDHWTDYSRTADGAPLLVSTVVLEPPLGVEVDRGPDGVSVRLS
ncbi:hypothetical protein ACFYXL_16730 [Streptomyces tsukubensis]|uniref:hypothetical protein n=1 Tax=Streptomyces tsukubensis TaxID=83656 RepID=UPI00369B215D